MATPYLVLDGDVPQELVDADAGEFVMELVSHILLAGTPGPQLSFPRLEPTCLQQLPFYTLAFGMSLEDLLIAHKVVSWLLPDELEALGDLLERLPLPAPAGCVVPLEEFRRQVAAEFGEESCAVQQLESLIL